MQVKANQVIEFSFCTADPVSGAGLDPTTLGIASTGKLYINGVQDAAAVALTDDAATSSGITKVSYTVPSAVNEGDTVQCIITATVGGVVASSVVRDDQVITSRNYPTTITYNLHGDIDTVTWDGGTVMTYAYDVNYQLTGVTEE